LIKNKRIVARCTEVDRKILKLLANHDGRNPSEMVLAAIRECAIRRGLWPPEQEKNNLCN